MEVEDEMEVVGCAKYRPTRHRVWISNALAFNATFHLSHRPLHDHPIRAARCGLDWLPEMLQDLSRGCSARRFYSTFFQWSRSYQTARCARRQGSLVYRSSSSPRLQSKLLSGCRQTERKGPVGASRLVSTDAAPAMPKSEARLGMNTSNINVQADISTHVRHAMRRIPHPVVVITSAAPTQPEDAPETAFRAMTVSSFNTVTLDPTPLVSFNVRVPSATHSAMTVSGFFLAHLLAANETGAAIAHTLAKGGQSQGQAFQSLVERGDAVQIFSGLKTAGAPLLAGSGVLQVLRCRTLEGKDVEIGDHRVVVAEVVSVMSKPSSGGSAASDQAMGLSYCDRGYRALGDPIDPEAQAEKTSDSPVQRTLGMNVRRGDEAGR